MTEPVSEQPVLSAKLIELERIAPNSERVEHSYKRGEVFLIEENPYQEEEEEEDSSEDTVQDQVVEIPVINEFPGELDNYLEINSLNELQSALVRVTFVSLQFRSQI